MPSLVSGTQLGAGRELDAGYEYQPKALGLKSLRQVRILIVWSHGCTHEADSRLVQLLYDHLLVRGAEILKAVYIDANHALSFLGETYLAEQGQDEESSPKGMIFNWAHAGSVVERE
ncbi:MAG: hypothetical protein ABSD67_10600 [Terracidiphilus sp.]|jgi:hypothetical protein